MANNVVCDVKLPDSVRDKFFLLTAALEKKSVDPYIDAENVQPYLQAMLEKYLNEAKENQGEREDAETLLLELEKGKKGVGSPALVIRNLPIPAELPATPQGFNDFDTHGMSFAPEYIHLAISGALGVTATRSEGNQDLRPIHNVVPKLYAFDKNTYRGAGYLSVHSEDSPVLDSPEYVSLVYLKQKQGHDTSVVLPEDVMTYFSPEQQTLFHLPVFQIRSGDSLDENKQNILNTAICSYDRHNNLRMRLFASETRTRVAPLEVMSDFVKQYFVVEEGQISVHSI